MFLTHEHQSRIDFEGRAESDRSARADSLLGPLVEGDTAKALQEMGFVVRRIAAGDEIAAGSLRLRTLATDQNEAIIGRTMPLLISFAVNGHGSFFTSVDMKQDPLLRPPFATVDARGSEIFPTTVTTTPAAPRGRRIHRHCGIA